MTLLKFTTTEMFNRTMNINALGTFLGIRTVAPLMREQGGGSIVCIASTGAVRGGARLATYCASKGTVRQLCKSLALKLIPFNIRVNMVSPGPCNTPMVGRMAAEINQRPASIGELSPIGRLAKPREIAEAVLFLASDRSSYMVSADVGEGGGNTSGLTGPANL